MKGDKTVIQLLNKQLANELAAINQYFLHSRMLDDWGVTKLAKHEYKESIEEMQHADELIKRILFLDGLPNLQDLHKLKIGENVPECMTSDLSVEVSGRVDQVAGIKECEAAEDYVSRQVLREILTDTEEHIDFLETQLSLVKALGEQNYLQSALGELEGGVGH